MKFYGKLIIIIVGVIVGLWFLRTYQESQPSPSASPQPSAMQREALPSSSSPAAPSAQGTFAPTPPPPLMTPEDTARQRFVEMARTAGVELVDYRRDGDWFVVTIRSTDRNRLFDFLDVAQRNGLRSLDVKAGPNYQEFMGRDGRLVFQATHRMKF